MCAGPPDRCRLKCNPGSCLQQGRGRRRMWTEAGDSRKEGISVVDAAESSASVSFSSTAVPFAALPHLLSPSLGDCWSLKGSDPLSQLPGAHRVKAMVQLAQLN